MVIADKTIAFFAKHGYTLVEIKHSEDGMNRFIKRNKQRLVLAIVILLVIVLIGGPIIGMIIAAF